MQKWKAGGGGSRGVVGCVNMFLLARSIVSPDLAGSAPIDA